ncbi:hypothetical protein [Halomonas sp. QHL1]|uniref:hypothetical protein n=1 Tax=Halomonas sp. QHL1 TaxID=1123773 RepID=UPI0008FD0375|nr:hypothetical protein [Halomonas sp. QHL1]OJA06897.1 hypothetical protein QHL1GM_16620 [Halomonas sp. QHL1]
MSKETIDAIQKSLLVIRNQLDKEDAETKLAALQLLMGTSQSVVAMAKKLTKPKVVTKKQKIAIPQRKIVKQPPIKQPPNSISNDKERRSTQPIRPQPPLSNQRN